MTSYLLREQSPLTPEQWQAIDETVTGVARRLLVGRRFIPLFGPFGPGLQTIADDVFGGVALGAVDRFGEAPVDVIRPLQRTHVPLPILYKDFVLHWRDLETSRQFGVPLDTSAAAAASAYCARAEDNLIFNGDPALGFEGLLNATGRSTLPARDWTVVGNAFADVVAATQTLTENNRFAPYALVTSPRLFTAMHQVYANTGVLEIEQVQKLVTAGVYVTPVLPEPTAIVVSTGAQNMDLVIGQDLITAFLETTRMNHYLRVFEIVALRIKQPDAICTLERIQPTPRGRAGRRPRRAEGVLESPMAETPEEPLVGQAP